MKKMKTMKVIFILTTLCTLAFSQQLDQGSRALRGYIAKQNGVTLPPILENFADISTSLNSNEVPVYWHVLKSGGTTMKQMLGKCMNFVLADKKDQGTENVRIKFVILTNIYIFDCVH